MPKFIGQTDKVLVIQLPSTIEDAKWSLDAVALGGRIGLEVQTHWVGEDSDIQITIKNLEGNTIEVLKGKVFSNVYSMQYHIKKPNTTGGMFFEIEMKAHKLKAIGPRVRVWPAIKITPRLLDENEKEISEIEDTKIFAFEAKVQGAPIGALCFFDLGVIKNQRTRIRIVRLIARVKDGKALCLWKGVFPKDEAHFENKALLSKKAENYEIPQYALSASCMGVMSESAPIPYSSWVEFGFDGKKGKATLLMPDGTTQVKPVPESGILKVEKPKAGQIRVKTFEHELPEIQIHAEEDEAEEKRVGMGDLKEVERKGNMKGKDEGVKKKKLISGKGLKFPLTVRPASYHSRPGKFGTPRSGGKKKDRLHGGCDLYAPVGTEVYSVAKGKVWKVAEFYLGTCEVTVNHGDFMVRYGELKKNFIPEIYEGADVEKGDLLGYVGKLNGLKISMVHFELYEGTGTEPLTDHANSPYYRRKDLIDPTTFLDELGS